jgi:hypothetical protein
MPRKEFEAFTRLDASDVNTFLMDQSVMSFAGTAARGSAIGTAVEGMTTFLEDSDQLEIWNGSAWKSPFGLTLVKQQTVGAGATSVVVSDAFSAAYEDYKVIYSGGVSSGANYIALRLGASGTPATASNYKTAFVAVSYSTSAVTGAGTTDTSFAYAGRATTNFTDLSVELRSPFLAKHTRFSSAFSLDNGQGANANGVHESAVSYNDLILLHNALTGGTISVYGYRKD